ncbi:conserved hypothetical protein [Culex quinquefasciatus]|uniref:Uncharacterized protein n=1 Tax=Culex quinquefasciatus TaxID=7176 RepID=B0WAZ8_CULQU|nr:conserved hypothetical protein [Culex quinquefasciatus]|eukprot:XP_001845882.1 conserved hypothetical protein [Culex quinquefasciatus]
MELLVKTPRPLLSRACIGVRLAGSGGVVIVVMNAD